MARRSKKGQADSPALPGIEPKDEELMNRALEFRQRAITNQQEIESAKVEVARTKEAYDGAKGWLKKLEAKRERLMEEEAHPENYPIINEVEAKERKRAKGQLGKAREDLEQAGEDWRRVQVTEIGISEYAADTLKDGGLGNVGALCDYVDGGGQLKNIKGLGADEVRMIEQALSRLAAKLKAEEQPEGPKPQASGEPLAKVEGIKPIFVKCLEQKGGITTVEQALAHIQQHGSLHTIEGISERAAGQIAEAIASHRQARTDHDRADETALWEVGGISVHLRTCLERAGLSTVEAVQRYDAEGKKLSDIDGISTGEAIAIMGAIDEFTGQGKAGKPKKPRAKGTAKKTRPAASAG